MAQLNLKGIWNAPGYRDITLDLIDPTNGREHRLHIGPADLQRLINACADAAAQIGTEGPLDWDHYPTPVYWPNITTWKNGSRFAKAEGR